MNSSKISHTLLSLCETEEEKNILRQQINANSLLLEKLKEAVEKRIEHSRKTQEHIKWFVAPNWSYRQANSLGMIRGLKFLLDILS